MATVRLASTNSDAIQKRLHFCLFDNGDDDYIYVGTKYGMWANGEFDLSNNGRVVFTGRVPNLLYSGVYIPMGAVLSNQPGSNISIEITRVTGWFK